MLNKSIDKRDQYEIISISELAEKDTLHFQEELNNEINEQRLVKGK
ncbi:MULTISPECIES: hypothetical protein [Staphylococcus]|nr:hypothetical protein [Staphylococcus sp. GDH8C109P]